MCSWPSFPKVCLEEIVDILDNLRVPVNEFHRMKHQGSVPYYGANGQQGWIDRSLFNEPLILMAEDGGNFDDHYFRPIAYRVCGPSWVNNHAHILRAKQGINQSFVFWSLVNKDIRTYIAGGTRAKLTQGELRKIEINLPRIEEQIIISELLDSLERCIRETEAIIAKLEAVRKGLLHDLLTRGIGADGELRPPQSEAPHLYKQSPLGWIPKEWEVLPLECLTKTLITYGIVQAGPHYPGGIPYIRTGDMSGDRLVRDSMLCTSPRIASQYKRSEILFGEIVIAIRATVGKVLPVPENLDRANLTQGTARISPDIKRVDSGFLLFALRDNRVREAMFKEVKGTTFAEISLTALRTIPIPFPRDMKEQITIGRAFNLVDSQISFEKESRSNMNALKSGLMDDLLTGRVRVTPLLRKKEAA